MSQQGQTPAVSTIGSAGSRFAGLGSSPASCSAAVSSRLVRKYWGEPLPCPKCGYAPIQTGLLMNSGRMMIRFECPNEGCTHKSPRYAFTHQEAVSRWNGRRQNNKLSDDAPAFAPAPGSTAVESRKS